MTVLNDADKLYLGAQEVDRVYLGDSLVWEPSGFEPPDLADLTVWLDASQLGLADGAAVSPWPNLGSGGDGGIVGSPAPTLEHATLNGLPVVRFKINEGRVRGNGMVPGVNAPLTILYVGRLWGPNVGRIFSNAYPPYNFLVGMHSSGYDTCYDNGWISSGIGWPGAAPLPWRMWGLDFIKVLDVATSRFFVDGAFVASGNTSSGHDGLWNLSGYDATGAAETCDCEVAELVIYARKLPDAERAQVEAYLTDKWGL